MSRPDGYPLPWCHVFGLPYWQINAMIRCRFPGWRKFQAGKDMAQLIPVIDWLLEGWEQ